MGIFLLLLGTFSFSFVENLKTAEQLIYKPQQFKRTLSSTAELNGCTGVFISNQGHLLTALHCLQGGLPPKMENKPAKKIYGRWEYAFVPQEVYAPGRQVYPGKLIDFYVSGKEYVEAEIVFSGERLGVNYLDTEAEDFIILKLPVSEKTDCSPTALGRPKTREMLWAYGYPSGFTSRNGVESEDGMTLKISNGLVNETLAQGLGKAVDLVRNETQLEMREFLSDVMEYRKNIYVASVDVDEGMSGGPIFNSKGELVGITSLAVPTVLPSGGKKRVGFQSIYSVIQAMRETAGSELTQQAFDCEVN